MNVSIPQAPSLCMGCSSKRNSALGLETKRSTATRLTLSSRHTRVADVKTIVDVSLKTIILENISRETEDCRLTGDMVSVSETVFRVVADVQHAGVKPEPLMFPDFVAAEHMS